MQINAAHRAFLVVAAHGTGVRAVDDVHRGVVVDLQQPSLQLLVNQNVEAENLIHL